MTAPPRRRRRRRRWRMRQTARLGVTAALGKRNGLRVQDPGSCSRLLVMSFVHALPAELALQSACGLAVVGGRAQC